MGSYLFALMFFEKKNQKALDPLSQVCGMKCPVHREIDRVPLELVLKSPGKLDLL